jgi:hypothetical protein
MGQQLKDGPQLLCGMHDRSGGIIGCSDRSGGQRDGSR